MSYSGDLDVTRIEHPNDRPNFAIVDLPHVRLAYSYKTCIGYQPRLERGWGDWQVRVNEWGPTTGKHISLLRNTYRLLVENVPTESFKEGLQAAVMGDHQRLHMVASSAFKSLGREV